MKRQAGARQRFRTLNEGYRLLAQDRESEQEAKEWCDSTFADWFGSLEDDDARAERARKSKLDCGESPQ